MERTMKQPSRRAARGDGTRSRSMDDARWAGPYYDYSHTLVAAKSPCQSSVESSPLQLRLPPSSRLLSPRLTSSHHLHLQASHTPVHFPPPTSYVCFTSPRTSVSRAAHRAHSHAATHALNPRAFNRVADRCGPLVAMVAMMQVEVPRETDVRGEVKHT